MLARSGLLLAMLLVLGCGDQLLSKEQQQLSAAVKQAITQNPRRIDEPYADGEPPLHIALTNHLPGLFDWLLDRGADPNVRDKRGETALHKAVIFDSPDHAAMRALLKRGADVNAKGDDGGTPLHLAAYLSRATSVEALLAAGADPNARDRLGETPLHGASAPQPTASPADVERTIHLLLAGGADPGARQTNGGSPLHRAALAGSVVATRSLLSEGVPVDLQGMAGQTALHVAATFARPQVAEILLVAGADPNRRDDSGLTPLARALHYPAASGTGPVDTREVVDLLRRFGATEQDAASSAMTGNQAARSAEDSEQRK
jgi:ankyrin repeat protein